MYQIGIAPVRVDILTHISGVEFSDAWQRRIETTMFGVPVPFIALDDLVRNKEAAGRGADLEHLKHIQKEKGGNKE